MKKEGRSKDVLDYAAVAKAHFQDAAATAKPRRPVGARILDACHAALEAGLRNSAPLIRQPETVDDKLKGKTKQFSRELKPEEFSEFQKEYSRWRSRQQKEGALKATEDVLKSQEEQLARASTQVRFQQAMDEARKTLPQSDALVYQQGNTLVFRLKRINFKSGTAVIPESSKPLLAQVNATISRLDAEKVVVEGHTDSVGADDVNQRLSQERAIAVANHLHSLNAVTRCNIWAMVRPSPSPPMKRRKGAPPTAAWTSSFPSKSNALNGGPRRAAGNAPPTVFALGRRRLGETRKPAGRRRAGFLLPCPTPTRLSESAAPVARAA